MVVNIKKEDTGKKDYFSWNNLLVKALRREGLTNVYLQDSEWNGTKLYLFGIFKFKKEGYISPKANSLLKSLSDHPSLTDIQIDLEKI